MYINNPSGCLAILLILFLIGLFIKEFWWLIVGIAIILIILYYANLIYQNIIQSNKEKHANYTPEMGEVYKVCPYCNAKVSVTAIKCPVCNHELN